MPDEVRRELQPGRPRPKHLGNRFLRVVLADHRDSGPDRSGDCLDAKALRDRDDPDIPTAGTQDPLPDVLNPIGNVGEGR